MHLKAIAIVGFLVKDLWCNCCDTFVAKAHFEMEVFYILVFSSKYKTLNDPMNNLQKEEKTWITSFSEKRSPFIWIQIFGFSSNFSSVWNRLQGDIRYGIDIHLNELKFHVSLLKRTRIWISFNSSSRTLCRLPMIYPI